MKVIKSKNPKFLSMYSWATRWSGAYRVWGATLWREAFGNVNKLPASQDIIHAMVRSTDGAHEVMLILHPSGKKGSMKHRVHVICDRCMNEVPAGRINQHTC